MSGKCSVAMPWSLSHYILLNGFHPLYRALIDHAPSGLAFNAWDNVRLYERLTTDAVGRAALVNAASVVERENARFPAGSVESDYHKFFWPPNRVLSGELRGDLEFHHTAPFPTLERPFVFHCESFAPVFLPFFRQGAGEFQNHEEVRRYYLKLFANPLCLGIFSHIPETLASLSRFFSDALIDAKLFGSKIGLSSQAIAGIDPAREKAVVRPRFLFVNSANQNPQNFFLRGGHIVLRFWQEFRGCNREGVLLMRCGKPSTADLAAHGVDAAFVETESGRSIVWAEDYLANHELNAVIASANFFLLPSASLHSVSIMQAMALGAIPVVTDTVGTDVCVTDGENGVVLQGVRVANWYADPNTGVLVDRYQRNPALDDSLVAQLLKRILPLLDAPPACEALRQRGLAHARSRFSGADYSEDFWGNVAELLGKHRRNSRDGQVATSGATDGWDDCMLRGGRWANVFESVTQPVQKIHTGDTIVAELGGASVLTYSAEPMRLNDWSVMSQFWVMDAPRMTFANSINELGGAFLAVGGRRTQGMVRRLTRAVSKLLRPYPELHSFAASMLKKLRRQWRLLVFHLGRLTAIVSTGAKPAPNRAESDTPTLVVAGYYGFNIIHLHGEFHAILQGDGAFDISRLKANGYRRSYSAASLNKVQGAILAGMDADSADTAGKHSGDGVNSGS